MKHLDLFSGIGGFALAASWVWGAEHEIVSFCEIDPFCQKVLNKHWPDVPIISDIRDVTYERIMADTRCKHKGSENESTRASDNPSRYSGRENQRSKGINQPNDKENCSPTIDLLTGGFPCQPFSCAGKQGGEKDDRYLWPEMLRIISEIRPAWIIGENVAGIINLALDQVLSDLENEGYTCQPFIVPACAKDAPHRRDRVWIVAHSGSGGFSEPDICSQQQGGTKTIGSSQDVSDNDRQGLQNGKSLETKRKKRAATNGSGGRRWLPEPNVGRVAHGVRNRVDRLKSLGNAIVPQVVQPIMQAIKDS